MMHGDVTQFFVHDTAEVEGDATIGVATRIWHYTHVRTRAVIGARCILGKGVFIDFGVIVGDDCKIQNYACLYHGVKLGRGVFVGPHAVFTNDMRPRATTHNFSALRDGDWEVGKIVVGDGAAIGANVTILPNVTIGEWAMIGAGAVVTRDVPSYAVAAGAPARLIGWACVCGARLDGPNCNGCGSSLPAAHPLNQAVVHARA